jgi:hypothetical protein
MKNKSFADTDCMFKRFATFFAFAPALKTIL